MPLLRGLARTAAIAGTATAVSNRVSRRQYNRWSEQDAPPEQAAPPPQQAAPPAAPAGEDRLTKLKELGELHTQGVLTDAEFEAEKAKILQS